MVKKKAKSVKKKRSVKKEVSSPTSEVKNFLVVYQGLAGRKAVDVNEAKQIGRNYIKNEKTKKFDVYELVEGGITK